MPIRKKKLSGLEWEIMEIVWQQEKPVSVREVLEIAYPNGEKAYTTVQTVMNHLVDKGFAKKEKIGLVNFYTPTNPREEMLEGEVSRFVDRTFGGSINALVSFMLDTKSLSADEVASLKALIDQKTAEDEEEK